MTQGAAPAIEEAAGVAETDGHQEKQQQLGAIAGVGEQYCGLVRVSEHLQDTRDEDEKQGQRCQTVGQQQLAYLLDGHAAPEQEILGSDRPCQGDHGAIVQRHQQVRVQHP